VLAHPPCPMFRRCPRLWSLTRQLTLHETTYQQSLLSACRSKHEFLNTRKSSTDIILSRNNWSLLSTAFVMLHLVSGINFLYLFINLILVPVPQFLTHLFLHPSLLPHLIHHSAHPNLPLFHSQQVSTTQCECLTSLSFICDHGLLLTLAEMVTFVLINGQ